MKKFFYLLLILLIPSMSYAQKAKYIFYFIGDGMGLNQVNATEMYLGEKDGKIGTSPLLFANFPASGYATSFSATNSVTDSAAGGTALATGTKTYNSAMSVDVDKKPLQSIAERAKKAGMRVGVTTSVSVDHATPGVFYAHQPKRNMYYEIACDLPKSNFDFFAGSGFLKPHTNFKGEEAPSIYPMLEEAGYTLVKGVDEYNAQKGEAKKMILIQKDGKDVNSIPYAIDRQAGDLSLQDITRSAIEFLSKDAKKGFFLMVEGGKIDWACHGNDAATMVNEVIDMDNAVKIAYEFYKKHPKETLIVISADHETGGLGLGNGKYEMTLKNLQYQKESQDVLSNSITDLRKHKHVSWKDVKALLADKMGFWKEIPLTWDQEKMLRDEYEKSFVKNKVVFEKSLYAKTEPLAAAARVVMSQAAQLGWISHSHSDEYVPVFAIGAGQKLFMGKMDNTEIPKKIAKAAGLKW